VPAKIPPLGGLQPAIANTIGRLVAEDGETTFSQAAARAHRLPPPKKRKRN
jgi:hypothetical protein